MMYMTSTNLKNSCGMYKLEQNINRNSELSQVYKGQGINNNSKFANLGINNQRMIGGYYNSVLSNNPTDIESSLYGIGSSNLVEKKEPTIPQLNNLKTATFFDPKLSLFVPQPLVVRKHQRETGPFS